MNKSKKIGILLVFLILLLTFIKEAAALGITPGEKITDFEPKLRKQITLTVINTEHKSFKAAILTRGELAKYIELSQNSIEFSESESEKSFSYEIILPDRMEKPGSHSAEIVVRGLPSENEGPEISVSALVAVVSLVKVRVPYPGKYAEGVLDIASGNLNQDVRFFLRVSNLGELDISKAKAFFYIYDADNNLLTVTKSEEQGLRKGERKEFLSRWNANISLGSYKVTSVLDYDGVLANYENTFKIGDFFAKLVDISVKNFKLGSIAKFNILVENAANEKIDGLTAEMILLGQDSKQIANIKSNPEILEAKSKKELAVFWDTDGISEGVYEGKLILKYNDKTSEKQVKVKVSKDKIETEIFGITGKVIAAEENQSASIFTKDSLIIWGIIILVLFNIGFVIYFIKTKKKE